MRTVSSPALRRFAEKGRPRGRVQAGTRKAGTVQDAAASAVDGRNVCASALRKHVWTELIDVRWLVVDVFAQCQAVVGRPKLFQMHDVHRVCDA